MDTFLKIYVHFLLYRSEPFLECKMFQTEVVEKFKTHIICSTKLSEYYVFMK